MSSSSDRAASGRRRVDLAVLKSWNFAEFEAEERKGRLPYRIDHLRLSGIRLHWTDSLHTRRWQESASGSILGRVESLTVPFAQTLLMSADIRRASATLAMFESEANFLAATRRIMRPRRRSPLLVIACWLAEVIAGSGAFRRAGYRQAYRSVDVLYYFSDRQGPILADLLQLPEDRLRHLPFGIDTDFFVPRPEQGDRYLLAVGRDRGRDWSTFFEAVHSVDIPVKVCCRPSQIAGMKVPSNVEVLGHVSRSTYRQLLAGAGAVAVLTHPLSYPSGQSVVLEAMAMAKAVIATETPSLAEYLQPGIDCLTVPPHESAAARQQIESVLADRSLAKRLGVEGRRTVEAKFSAKRMWNSVAEDIFRLARTP